MRARRTPILDTPRLILRPRRVEDAEALFPGFADVDAMRWGSGPAHTAVEQTRERLAVSDPAWRNWAITMRGDDTAIGFVMAGEKWQGDVTEVGYMLLRAHWRGGLMREAVSEVINRIFREGQRRVFADADVENLASRGLLESLGFRLEGQLRGEWVTHIGVRDSALYGLLAGEWSMRGGKNVQRPRHQYR